MANINNLSLFLKDIASSIRNKKGTSDLIPAANFDTEIASIETGVDTSDANAVPDDITMNKTAYVNGEKITGNLPLFPDSRTYTADGYVTNDTENSKIKLSTMNATKQILDSNVNIEMSTDYSDIATVINLTADKVKKDETVLGVTGTYEGDNINDYFNTVTSDAGMSFMNTTIAGCIKKLPPLDTSKSTNMQYMFQDCTELISIPEMNTSNVTTMNGMFSGCRKIETIPNIDTSKVTDMYRMFNNCYSLVSIPEMNTQNVTSMGYMFAYCNNLTSIPEMNTSKVTNMNNMFYNCYNLAIIPILNMNKVTNLENMFTGCSPTEASLNNILSSLLTATVYTGTKTLQYIGLTQEQAQICTTLSNWAACEAAGWTTGY